MRNFLKHLSRILKILSLLRLLKFLFEIISFIFWHDDDFDLFG